MENNDSPVLAALSAIISFGSGIFALITFQDVQLFMTLIVSGVGAISGAFAIRHYYFATKKIIKEIKKLNEPKL